MTVMAEARSPAALAPISGMRAEALDLGRIYREHAATVSRWARRLLGPGGDVEDALQEVFLVAHKRLSEFRGDASITTWLHAITVRVAQAQRRRAWWRRWLGGREPAAGLPAPGPTPLQALESLRASDLTYRLLDRLSAKDRTLLILFELEGASGDEVAAVLGVSTATVWVRLHRARARFAREYLAWETALSRRSTS